MKRATSTPAGLNVKKITAYLKGQAKKPQRRSDHLPERQRVHHHRLCSVQAARRPLPGSDPARDHAGRPPPMA